MTWLWPVAFGLTLGGVVARMGGDIRLLYGGDPWRCWLLSFGGSAAAALGCWLGAIGAFMEGDSVWFGILVALCGIWVWRAWRAWRRRPPRDRKLSRLVGRVRDLGHRLVVAPEGSAA